MAEKKLTRKELLKSPDELMTLTQRAFEFVQIHTRHLVIILVAILAVSALIFGIARYRAHQEAKAIENYNLAISQIEMLGTEPTEAEAAIQELNKVIDQYPDSPPARTALLNLGDLYYSLKKYPEAQGAYQDFLSRVPSDENELQPIVLDSLGYTLEAQGKYDDAAGQWEKIVQRPGDQLKQEALVSLGRVYQAAGQKDKSIKAYQDLIEKYPGSPYRELAKARLNEMAPTAGEAEKDPKAAM